MAGLLDIAPLTETVTIGTTDVTVRGLTALDAVHLIGRFPEVKDLMASRAVSVERWTAIGGEALAAIIAAGIGFPGDIAQEKAAAGLGLEAQADLLNAIKRVTAPRGIGPFVEAITALLGLDGVPSPKVQATKSPKPSKP